MSEIAKQRLQRSRLKVNDKDHILLRNKTCYTCSCSRRFSSVLFIQPIVTIIGKKILYIPQDTLDIFSKMLEYYSKNEFQTWMKKKRHMLSQN